LAQARITNGDLNPLPFAKQSKSATQSEWPTNTQILEPGVAAKNGTARAITAEADDAINMICSRTNPKEPLFIDMASTIDDASANEESC